MYDAIRKWHERSGSHEYYIKDLIDRAVKENAPQNAIYRDRDRWVTTDDLSKSHSFFKE